MKIITKEDYLEMSKEAANMVKNAITEKPDLVLGLITGSTPLGFYKELIRMHREDNLDFSKVTVFNLDEYLGLPSHNEQSYCHFMKENLIKHINIKEENFFIPDGEAENPEESCSNYEQKIDDCGGVDLQFLGIGTDGHIGFNEPGTSFSSRTHIAELAEPTIKDNSRFFKDESEVPRYAITVGIGTILDSKKVVLLASGDNKSEVCKKFIEGPITPDVPASALQKHGDVTVILDKQASSKLKKI